MGNLLDLLRMEDSVDQLLNEREEYETKLVGLHNDLKVAKEQTKKVQIRFAEYLLNTKTPINEIITLTELDEPTVLMLSKSKINY
jgi:hypothetical protein